MKKTVSAIVCTAIIATSTIPTTSISYAAESKQEQATGEWKKVSLSEETPQVSSVPKGNAYVPKGTVLEVELTKEISSKKMHSGDPVPLRLTENLIINDVIVAPAGSEVKGIITKARKAGGLGRGGKLEFSIVSVKTINGVEIPLDFTKEQKGSGDAGAVAVFAAVSIVGGLFMKGKNVTFQEGTKFKAEVTVDTDLKTKLEGLAEAMNPDKPHGVSITIQ